MGVVESAEFDGEDAVTGPGPVMKCAAVFCSPEIAGGDAEIGGAAGLRGKGSAVGRPGGGGEGAGLDAVPADG